MPPNKEKAAAKKICALASRENVLAGLMENGITIAWVIAQLKDFSENSGSPAQLSALKKLMEMMSQGGILTSANLSGTKVKEELPKDDDQEGEAVKMPTIDEIVNHNSTKKNRKAEPDAHCHDEGTQAA